MKIRIVITIFLTIGIFTAKAQNSDSAQIASIFNQYKYAIQNNDGAKAFDLIDSNTINWYSDILELIKSADSSVVSNLTLNDKLTVLVSRQAISHDSLINFSARELFEYSINNSNGTSKSVSAVQLGIIQIENDVAEAKIQATPQGDSIKMIFRFQDDSWKFDLTSIFDASIELQKTMIADIGISENEYALYVLEQFSGVKPPNEVWFPIEGSKSNVNSKPLMKQL